jgi:hypothetical protein
MTNHLTAGRMRNFEEFRFAKSANHAGLGSTTLRCKKENTMPTYDCECANCKKEFTVSTTIAEI